MPEEVQIQPKPKGGRPPGTFKDRSTGGAVNEAVNDSIKMLKYFKKIIESQLEGLEAAIKEGKLRLADRLDVLKTCVECHKQLGETTKRLADYMKSNGPGSSEEGDEEMDMEDAIKALTEKHS